MVEPVSVSMVTFTILRVVPLICNAALKARQNREKCSELAARASNLEKALPSFTGAVAENDEATAQGLARLNEALVRALRLIESCKAGGILRRINKSKTAADLDSVDRTINNCLTDLNFFSIAAHATSTHGVTPAAQTYNHSSYHHHQAQGGAPSLQHIWGSPPAPCYYQPPGYTHWVPSPAPYYAASPAPSGSRLCSLFLLPIVSRIFERVFR
ncbi:unnamed protein product [Alopecurus aequalis]